MDGITAIRREIADHVANRPGFTPGFRHYQCELNLDAFQALRGKILRELGEADVDAWRYHQVARAARQLETTLRNAVESLRDPSVRRVIEAVEL